MANYSTLKAAVEDVVKTNGEQEITGANMQTILLAIINSLGAYYQFAGVATPATNPQTPDQNVMYLAFEAGNYANFNSTQLPAGISVFLWNGTWTHQTFFAIDDVPTVGSDNFVKSGGVFSSMLKAIGNGCDTSDDLGYSEIGYYQIFGLMVENGVITDGSSTRRRRIFITPVKKGDKLLFKGINPSGLMVGSVFYSSTMELSVGDTVSMVETIPMATDFTIPVVAKADGYYGAFFDIPTTVNIVFNLYKQIYDGVVLPRYLYKETLSDIRSIQLNTWVNANPASENFGEIVSTPANFNTTDYFTIAPNTLYIRTSIPRLSATFEHLNECGYVFYDSEKNPISDGFGGCLSSIITDTSTYDHGIMVYIKVPSGAAYFRKCTDYNNVTSIWQYSAEPVITELQKVEGDLYGEVLCNSAESIGIGNLILYTTNAGYKNYIMSLPCEGKKNLNVKMKVLSQDVSEDIRCYFQLKNSYTSTTSPVGLVYQSAAISYESGMTELNVDVPVENATVCNLIFSALPDRSAELSIADVLERCSFEVNALSNIGTQSQIRIKTFRLPLVAGYLETTKGLPALFGNNDGFLNYYITPKYLEVEDGSSISLDNIPSGLSVKVAVYRKNFTLVSLTDYDDFEGINYDGYVKFMVGSSVAFTSVPEITCTLKDTQVSQSWAFTAYPSGTTYKTFSFETYYPTPDNVDASAYTGDHQRRWDNGYLMLPPNYSSEGNAVPLVVFCHGTNGYSWAQTGIGSYAEYKNFIVNNGYALMDCSGLTNENKTLANVFDAPSAMSCYEDMYKYVTDSFNIRRDGVYVVGKSAGGFMTILLTSKQPFKVKAAACLAPAIAWTFSSLPVEAQEPIQLAMSQLGFGDYTWSAGINAMADKEEIIDNILQLGSNDPFFINSDIDAGAFLEILRTTHIDDDPTKDILWSVDGRHHLDISVLNNIINAAHKYLYTPTKIWIAKDDTEVPYHVAEMFQRMVQNTNGPCYLRTMPNGTGGHHSVDTSDSALKTYYQPIYGDMVEVPVAYAEVVDWFNRW